MSATEIPEWINRTTVERAWGRGVDAQGRDIRSFARIGMRAARSRDPRLLRALDGMAEILQQISQDQTGNRRRIDGRAIDATEYSLVREALVSADEGQPLPHFCWIYGMAATLCGYQ
jgi:hypothetical protein